MQRINSERGIFVERPAKLESFLSCQLRCTRQIKLQGFTLTCFFGGYAVKLTHD